MTKLDFLNFLELEINNLNGTMVEEELRGYRGYSVRIQYEEGSISSFIEEHREHIFLRSISATPTNIGLGSRFIVLLQEIANKSLASIQLFPHSNNDERLNALNRFYNRHEFYPISGEGHQDYIYIPIKQRELPIEIDDPFCPIDLLYISYFVFPPKRK